MEVPHRVGEDGPRSAEEPTRDAVATPSSRDSGGSGAVLANKGDAQHVGGAGRAKGDAGGDGDAIARAGIALFVGDDAGAIDHVLEALRIFGEEALDAPHDRQPTRRADL